MLDWGGLYYSDNKDQISKWWMWVMIFTSCLAVTFLHPFLWKHVKFSLTNYQNKQNNQISFLSHNRIFNYSTHLRFLFCSNHRKTIDNVSWTERRPWVRERCCGNSMGETCSKPVERRRNSSELTEHTFKEANAPIRVRRAFAKS